MYTYSDLISQVELDAFVPQGQSTWQPADILRVASSVIETEILPLILKTKGDFYLVKESIVFDSEGYARIPSRAIGNAIAEVRGPNFGPVHHDIITVGQKLYGQSVKGCSLECWYYLRPGKLTSVFGTITAVDSTSGIVSCSSVPTSYTTSLRFDFIRAQGGYEALSIEATCSNVDLVTNQMTFSSLPSDLAVGDYIVVADTSPVPQIPVELFGLLSHLTAIKMYQSNGDFEAANVLDKKTKNLKDNALSLICPRQAKNSKAIVRPNLR